MACYDLLGQLAHAVRLRFPGKDFCPTTVAKPRTLLLAKHTQRDAVSRAVCIAGNSPAPPPGTSRESREFAFEIRVTVQDSGAPREGPAHIPHIPHIPQRHCAIGACSMLDQTGAQSTRLHGLSWA